jgi:hypothetical protein
MKDHAHSSGLNTKLGLRLIRDAWSEAMKHPERFRSLQATAAITSPSPATAAVARSAAKGVATRGAQQGAGSVIASSGSGLTKATSVPAYAERFDPPNGMIIPSVPKLVLFLDASLTREQPLRVVQRKSAHGTWFEVECYNAGADAWFVFHTCAREEEAVDVANGRGREPAELKVEDRGRKKSAGAEQDGSATRKRGRPSRSKRASTSEKLAA